MYDFVNRLPWRLAAVAGLLVGVVRFAIQADVWNCMIWVAGAFLVFGLAGLGLRAILLQSEALKPARVSRETPPKRPRTRAADDAEEAP